MRYEEHEVPEYPLWYAGRPGFWHDERLFTITNLGGVLYRAYIREDSKAVLLLVYSFYSSRSFYSAGAYWRVLLEINPDTMELSAEELLNRVKQDLPSYLVLTVL